MYSRPIISTNALNCWSSNNILLGFNKTAHAWGRTGSVPVKQWRGATVLTIVPERSCANSNRSNWIGETPNRPFSLTWWIFNKYCFVNSSISYRLMVAASLYLASKTKVMAFLHRFELILIMKSGQKWCSPYILCGLVSLVSTRSPALLNAL